ncbi:MAG: hypothetical protein N2321_02765 [Melioribacteraceae bacterium]|nr:hypothetical protein [Melioribacteraceae bacterium]
MICLHKICDKKLDQLIDQYNSALSYLKGAPYFIDNIMEYSYYFSLLIKSIISNQESNNNDLESRIKFNSSFENKLLNNGINIQQLPSELNLKNILLEISSTINKQNKKADSIFNYLQESKNSNIESSIPHSILFPKQQNKALIISNNYDEDYLRDYFEKNAFNNIEIIRYKKFIKRKEEELKEYFVIGYFLEGYRDFEIYHNMSVTVNLYLYEFEECLYNNCINKYKSKLEEELQSDDRYFISGIKYEVPAPIPVSISQALQNIIDRTKDWNEKEFDINIDDPDENSNEFIAYRIEYEGTTDIDNLKSTDTVFDEKNNLIKVNKLKSGDIIRVYKLDFGEILLNTAMEFQSEVFTLIEKHSKLWKSCLNELYLKTFKENIHHLHSQLKHHGVNVKSSTVFNNWINGNTKFPKSDKVIKAIYEISKDKILGLSFNDILKSKRIYNSTMISLGRDLKDEIKNFLSNGNIGEIIQKNNITPETLRKAIDEQMPLRKIKNISTFLIKKEDVDE